MNVSNFGALAFRWSSQAVCEEQILIVFRGVIKHSEQKGTYEGICW